MQLILFSYCSEVLLFAGVPDIFAATDTCYLRPLSYLFYLLSEYAVISAHLFPFKYDVVIFYSLPNLKLFARSITSFQLPQSLIIRIERVGVLPSGNVFKLADHVEFGETLDVRDFCFYRNKEVSVTCYWFPWNSLTCSQITVQIIRRAVTSQLSLFLVFVASDLFA